MIILVDIFIIDDEQNEATTSKVVTNNAVYEKGND